MKKQALKIDLERHFPPGYEWRTELGLYALALVWASAWGIIGYFSRLSTELAEVKNGYDMAWFYDVLGKAFAWFPIVMGFMIITIALHYAHHHSGSKSVYLMRRLPDRWEFHRRCITAPLVSVIITIVIAAILFFAFYAAYMLLTPEDKLRPDQLEQLLKYWSVM